MTDAASTKVMSPEEIAARQLGDVPQMRLAVTGDLVQCALGSEWNRTTRAMVEAATGRPAATAMTAAVDALREVAATRVVVASPVSRGKLAAVREYLEAAGFAITKSGYRVPRSGVVVSFLATYLAAVFETPARFLPLYWIGGYAVFVALNVYGVELSFKVTVAITLAALACLAVFWISALPVAEFRRFALNITAGPDGRPWSERKKYVWWDEQRGRWTGYDVPDFPSDKRPDYKPEPDAEAMDAIAGTRDRRTKRR